MNFGFRTRLVLASILPAAIVVLLLFGFVNRHAADLEQALKDRGRAAARQLGAAAEFPLFAGHREALERLVEAAQAGDAQILGAAVLDSHGELRVIAGNRSLWEPRFSGQEQISDGNTLIVAAPIFRSTVVVDDPFAESISPTPIQQPLLVGYSVVELSREALDRQLFSMLTKVLVITLGGILFATWLSMRIAASVTRPLGHISEVVEHIERGRLSARAVVSESGVLAPLAAGINTMAAHVAMTQEDLRHQVELATEELRRQKEAAEMAARTDSLTGVANRRAFSEAAEQEVHRALRYGTPISLVMADLDFFKVINDRYGHPTGDSVLMSFTRTLTQAVRGLDLVGRWGGEEFVVLLPETGATEAVQAAERMRNAVQASEIYFHGQKIDFSASFGVAQFDPAELSFYDLLARADAALYRAKALGRNRVELAAPVLAPSLPEADGGPVPGG